MKYNNITIIIDNPFSNISWKPLCGKHFKLSKHFSCELNVYRNSHLIHFDTTVQTGGDHQGGQLMIGLFGYTVDIHVYDNRHEDE